MYRKMCCQWTELEHVKQLGETMKRFVGPGSGQGAVVSMHCMTSIE